MIDGCAHCGSYLGFQVVTVAADELALRVSQELIALLELDCLSAPLSNLRANLGRLIESTSSGNRASFARQHQVNPDLLKNWFNKPSEPALPQLVEVAIKVGVPAAHLVSAFDVSAPKSPLELRHLKPRKVRADRAGARGSEMQRALLCQFCVSKAPPTLAMAATVLHLTPAALRYRFPAETAALILARTSFLEEARKRRIANIDGAILKALDALTNSGRSVSRRRIEAQLSNQRLSLWQSNVRSRYQKLRRQHEPF